MLLNRGSTAVDVSVQVGSGDGASWLQVWLPARAIQTLRMKGDDATATSAESASITDEMGKRQHLLMQAYSRAALAKGQPPPCSQAEVYSFMFILSAGNTTEKALVLAALAALPTRCPGFLLPMESGFAASSSCALMRVNKLAANAAPAAQGEALPLASKLVIGRVLLNMSADPLRGSLWSFVTRRADDTIEIDDSENLDLANKIPVSLALELIAELPAPEFGPQLRLPDGHTVAEHCEAWACYWRTFFRTRALYGINVETSSTSYSKYFIEELACMHDLTLSQSLRALISDYMQVYFADAATEYISSLAVRGGAKSRCYHDYYSLNDGDPLGEVGWLLGWTGNATSPAYASDSYGNYYIHLAATSWRPLAQLAHIAHTNSDKALTKPFTYASHRLGRAADVGGDGSRPGICHRDGGQRGAMVAGICYFLNITEPSLLRQTYVAPEFMLGTLTFDPLCNYTAISSQNNVMGAVFSGSTADRLVFGGTGSIVSGRHGSYPLGTEFLSLSAVQVGPAAVLQRPLHASASNGSYTFISGALPHRGRPPWPGEGLLPSLRKTVEEWWCFHDTNGWTNNTRDSNASFGCVRFPGNEGSGTTNFTIDSHDAADSRGGILLLPVANMWAPTLVQLGRAADFDSFHSFVDSVRKLPVSWDPSSGHLKMTTLNGSTIETWAQSKRLPVVDGVPIHPPGVGFSGPVYGGPFLRGGGAVGVVEIAHPATGAVSLDFKSNVTRVGAVGLKVDNTGLASRLAQKKTDDEDWSPLKGLPALPKPHHSWLSWAPLFLHTDGPSAAVTRDVVRITGSCSVYACFGDRHSCHRPSRPCQNDSAGQAAVEACVRLAGPHNGTIAINFSPWYCAYKGSDPTDISQQAKEEEAAELALWQTNLGKIKRWLKGRAAVSAIL
eukprot:SAG11_NODE_496_length_8931_cov_2.956015_8_plen_900_part_00